jgi:hypothetical protein
MTVTPASLQAPNVIDSGPNGRPTRTGYKAVISNKSKGPDNEFLPDSAGALGEKNAR